MKARRSHVIIESRNRSRTCQGSQPLAHRTPRTRRERTSVAVPIKLYSQSRHRPPSSQGQKSLLMSGHTRASGLLHLWGSTWTGVAACGPGLSRGSVGHPGCHSGGLEVALWPPHPSPTFQSGASSPCAGAQKQGRSPGGLLSAEPHVCSHGRGFSGDGDQPGAWSRPPSLSPQPLRLPYLPLLY